MEQGNDAKAHVARCARVCYGRETGNDQATIKRLIDSEHWSMFRHGTYYIIANNIAEKSTRYVYEDGNICRPHWMTESRCSWCSSS